MAKLGRVSYLYNSIRKYGPSTFAVEIICCAPVEKLNALEQCWIVALDATNGAVGFNVEPGGNVGPVSSGNTP